MKYIKPLKIISRLTKIRKLINSENEFERDWHGFYRQLLEIVVLTEERLANKIDDDLMRFNYLERSELIRKWISTSEDRFRFFLKRCPIHKEGKL